MTPVTVLGAGKIGGVLARLLAATGDYAVTLADTAPAALDAHAGVPRLATRRVAGVDDFPGLLAGQYAVLSALPFQLTRHVARAAKTAGCHYFDLTEDVETTRLVRALAADAGTAFAPQCGLAPGFISIVAGDLARRFDAVDELRLRVGALPQFPQGRLGYALTWSTDGVINEYIQPCEALIDGRLVEVPALEGSEEFTVDGTRYEAFNTSGGLGSLAESLAGKARRVTYKSIRFPGHRAALKLLLDELRLAGRRDLLKVVLEGAIPTTMQDQVVIYVDVAGSRDGRLTRETYTRTVLAAEVLGRPMTAIQITTTAGICAVLDLVRDGTLPDRGLIRQEDIPLDRFLANRFGAAYAQGTPRLGEASLLAAE